VQSPRGGFQRNAHRDRQPAAIFEFDLNKFLRAGASSALGVVLWIGLGDSSAAMAQQVSPALPRLVRPSQRARPFPSIFPHARSFGPAAPARQYLHFTAPARASRRRPVGRPAVVGTGRKPRGRSRARRRGDLLATAVYFRMLGANRSGASCVPVVRKSLRLRRVGVSGRYPRHCARGEAEGAISFRHVRSIHAYRACCAAWRNASHRALLPEMRQVIRRMS
jgi:hypothetical protein